MCPVWAAQRLKLPSLAAERWCYADVAARWAAGWVVGVIVAPALARLLGYGQQLGNS